jgi:hypothetical protein
MADKGTPNSPGYQCAFERIRAEYLEMPGMRLKPEQVRRLSGVDGSICSLVLEDLTRARFLRLNADGTYARSADDEQRRSRLVDEATRTSGGAQVEDRTA